MVITAKYSFTKDQFEEIAGLLKNRAFEDRNKQKRTRAKIRKLGFRISDYHSKFSDSEFRELEIRGEIIITKSQKQSILVKSQNIPIIKGNKLVKKSLPPIVNNDTEYLILGTMPGEKSLKEQEYYNNPSNQFWRIISELFNDGSLFNDYSEKTNILLENKIGLWDVLKKCERKGSLDSAIQSEALNDFEKLFKKYPNIKTLIFNGNSSFKYFPLETKIKTIVLSSTSSTNTHKTLNEKIKHWGAVLGK